MVNILIQANISYMYTLVNLYCMFWIIHIITYPHWVEKPSASKVVPL